MRYDIDAIYFNENKEKECVHLVNVTSLGMDKQTKLLGAGELSEDYVTIRMREQVAYSAGYFKISDNRSFKIVKRLNVQKGTSFLGAEYNGRL